MLTSTLQGIEAGTCITSTSTAPHSRTHTRCDGAQHEQGGNHRYATYTRASAHNRATRISMPHCRKEGTRPRNQTQGIQCSMQGIQYSMQGKQYSMQGRQYSMEGIEHASQTNSMQAKQYMQGNTDVTKADYTKLRVVRKVRAQS